MIQIESIVESDAATLASSIAESNRRDTSPLNSLIARVRRQSDHSADFDIRERRGDESKDEG